MTPLFRIAAFSMRVWAENMKSFWVHKGDVILFVEKTPGVAWIVLTRFGRVFCTYRPNEVFRWESCIACDNETKSVKGN